MKNTTNGTCLFTSKFLDIIKCYLIYFQFAVSLIQEVTTKYPHNVRAYSAVRLYVVIIEIMQSPETRKAFQRQKYQLELENMSRKVPPDTK